MQIKRSAIWLLALLLSACPAPHKYGGNVNPSGGGGGGGGAPSGPAGGSLGGSYPNPTVIGSTFLQQPVMLVGTSAHNSISATTTTGTINTPPGVANGDLEVRYILLNNATSGTFVPPAGWTSKTSACTGTAAGNTTQVEIETHTASSEGATAAATTWTTNASGDTWITAYRNASLDVCAVSTAATSTTFTTGSLTAAATTDLITAVADDVANTNVGATTTPVGMEVVGASTNAGGSSGLEVAYPITNATVAGFGFTAANTGVWAGVQIGLAFASSTTAGAKGALTFNDLNPYLGALFLGSTQLVGRNLAQTYSLIMPSGACLAASALPAGAGLTGYPTCLISMTGSTQQINFGDQNVSAVLAAATFFMPVHMNANAFSTTSGSITSTTGNHQCTTCQIGTTGGGILSTTGGAAPTVTCSGGSTGTSVTAGSTNNRGQIVSSSSASTNCTITWSAAATWPQAPFCVFADGGASITPVTYSTGACGTATCIVDFASTTSKTINYVCM